MRAISRDLRTLFSAGAVGAIADGALLERFIAGRDEAAFEALIVRHGPMVWGVCRRVLGSHHDAEDAFQATFLVLARKAGTIHRRETLASWLYSVAYQTALKALSTAARRRARERPVSEMPEPMAAGRDPWLDLEPILDQELSRLPEAYRTAIVLCDLEGKSRREAADALGWPEGTLSSRLARGRGMLARRLARHGVALSGGALAAALSEKAATACVASSLVDSTVKAAALFAGQTAASVIVTAEVSALARGVLKTMLVAKLKVATAMILALGMAGAALATGDPPDPTAPSEASPAASAPAGLPGPDSYRVERYDPTTRSLAVTRSGPVRVGDAVLTNLHTTVELAEDGLALVNGKALRIEDLRELRPGVVVNLWIDHTRKPPRGVLGVVTRIELLANEPPPRPAKAEVKLDSSTLLETLRQAVEDEFDAASEDAPFERFWKDALAKLHHTNPGVERLFEGAKDCKSCHAMSHPFGGVNAPLGHEKSILNELTAQQREELVTSIAVERSMRAIRKALDAQRKLVPDSKAAARAIDEIEKGVHALKQTVDPAQAKPALAPPAARP